VQDPWEKRRIRPALFLSGFRERDRDRDREREREKEKEDICNFLI